MQRKDTLDTFSVRDSAHGECFIESSALTANDYASKYLDSLFVPFHHAGMNAYAIPDRKRRGIVSVLFFLNGIDDLTHEKLPLLARSGGRIVSSRIGEIATARRIILAS